MRRVLSLIKSRPRQASEPSPDPVPDSNHRRLYLLGTAFLARGMKAEDAYNKALYYTKGSGRRQNWISALAEQDNELPALPRRKDGSSDTPATVADCVRQGFGSSWHVAIHPGSGPSQAPAKLLTFG